MRVSCVLRLLINRLFEIYEVLRYGRDFWVPPILGLDLDIVTTLMGMKGESACMAVQDR